MLLEKKFLTEYQTNLCLLMRMPTKCSNEKLTVYISNHNKATHTPLMKNTFMENGSISMRIQCIYRDYDLCSVVMKGYGNMKMIQGYINSILVLVRKWLTSSRKQTIMGTKLERHLGPVMTVWPRVPGWKIIN